MIVQLIAAFLGSIGFALILKIRGRQVMYAGIGGLITWGIFLLAFDLCGSSFWSNLAAAVFVAVYAEIMARVNRAPATIFLTAAAVPLIPGGRLYYTMYGLVVEDRSMFMENGTAAVTVALAISLGFVIVAVLNKYLSRFLAKRRRKPDKPQGLKKGTDTDEYVQGILDRY